MSKYIASKMNDTEFVDEMFSLIEKIKIDTIID